MVLTDTILATRGAGVNICPTKYQNVQCTCPSGTVLLPSGTIEHSKNVFFSRKDYPKPD